jgi:hypothetical protein
MDSTKNRAARLSPVLNQNCPSQSDIYFWGSLGQLYEADFYLFIYVLDATLSVDTCAKWVKGRFLHFSLPSKS